MPEDLDGKCLNRLRESAGNGCPLINSDRQHSDCRQDVPRPLKDKNMLRLPGILSLMELSNSPRIYDGARDA